MRGYGNYLRSLSLEDFRTELSRGFCYQLESKRDNLIEGASDQQCVASSFLHRPLYNLRHSERRVRATVDWIMRIEVGGPDPARFATIAGQLELDFIGFGRVDFRLTNWRIASWGETPHDETKPEWPRRPGELTFLATLWCSLMHLRIPLIPRAETFFLPRRRSECRAEPPVRQ